uniref:Ovule protein n=1 Tax=Romanomermis culicivorax TaxID=13658 RepID=A0A915LC98_ROMCU
MEDLINAKNIPTKLPLLLHSPPLHWYILYASLSSMSFPHWTTLKIHILRQFSAPKSFAHRQNMTFRCKY